LRKAAEGFPKELVQRLTSTEELKDSDREAILQIGRDMLAPFQP
jgi:hypothetical protein